jgi:hypothetical protein
VHLHSAVIRYFGDNSWRGHNHNWPGTLGWRRIDRKLSSLSEGPSIPLAQIRLHIDSSGENRFSVILGAGL